jgi:hypothetical protein
VTGREITIAPPSQAAANGPSLVAMMASAAYAPIVIAANTYSENFAILPTAPPTHPLSRRHILFANLVDRDARFVRMVASAPS